MTDAVWQQIRQAMEDVIDRDARRRDGDYAWGRVSSYRVGDIVRTDIKPNAQELIANHSTNADRQGRA